MTHKQCKIVYGALSLIGLLGGVMDVLLFERTVVRESWLLLGLIPTLLMYFLVRDTYARVYRHSDKIYPFIMSLIIAGSISVLMVLGVNYLFTSPSRVNQCYDIEKIGFYGGRSNQPYVVLRSAGFDKQIVLNANQSVTIYDQICLTTAYGLLGMEVIKKIEVIPRSK